MTRRVLFVHTEGGLGDLLLSSPIAEAVARSWPGTAVTGWVSPAFAPLLEGNPWFDRAITLDPRAPFRGLLGELRRERFDIAVLPWTTGKQAWLTRLAGIPVRAGQARRLAYSWTFSHPVDVASARGDRTLHWVEVQLEYARVLGASANGAVPRLFLRPAEHQAAGSLLSECGITAADRVALLHIGKSLPLTPARWPLARFVETGRGLIAEGFRLVLTGSSAEVHVVREATDAIGHGAVSIAGRTDLRTLCAVIARCRVVVCPDSGPGHLAAALGVPVVSLFVVKSDPIERWRPFGVEHRIVTTAPWTCPKHCRKDTCERFDCLERFDAAEVVRAACELAAHRR